MSAPSTMSPGGGPPRSSGGRLLRLPRQIRRKLSHDRILGMSAEAGFWQLISLPSLLLAVFGALGYFSGFLGHGDIKRIHDDVLQAAGDVLSQTTVNDDVAPLVQEILTRGHAGVVSVSFVISLWSGSTATAAYLNTITVAYNMRGLRGVIRNRLVALGLYLLAVVAGIILLPALVLGPDAIADLAPVGARSEVDLFVRAVYWPLLVLASVGALATLYRLCLPVRVRWRAHLPGATFAMLIWLGGSIALRAYINHKLKTSVLYGALGAPVAALLFFYITALAVLLGAELNAALRGGLDPHALDRAGVEPAPPEQIPFEESDRIRPMTTVEAPERPVPTPGPDAAAPRPRRPDPPARPHPPDRPDRTEELPAMILEPSAPADEATVPIVLDRPQPSESSP